MRRLLTTKEINKIVDAMTPQVWLLQTDSSNLFYNNTSITSLSIKNGMRSTYLSYLFYGCTNLKHITIDSTASALKMNYMFQGCTSLEETPEMDTSKVTDIRSMFLGCSQLKTIPAYDFSNVTLSTGTFGGCSNLTSIKIKGLKTSFKINDSPKLSREALVELFNNIGTPTSSATLTLGSELLAKLTDEDKKIATDKGWTLA